MNKTILSGNITNDLEIRKTPTNKSVLSFKIAVNDGYGEKKTTDYLKCVAWENTAELIAKYCRKGSKILVEGKSKSEQYEKDGQRMYNDYILVNSVEFLDTRKETADTPKLTTEPRWDMSSATSTAKEEIKIEQDALPFY